MENFKGKYFRCFVGGKQPGMISHQHFSCILPSFFMSSCADLALLFCLRISAEGMCFWGRSGKNLDHGTAVKEAWEANVLKEAWMCPGEPIRHQKTDLILDKSKNKVLECFWYFISFNSFVISLFLNPGKWSFIRCWSSFCLENGILPRGWSQECYVKVQNFSCFMKPDEVD